MTELTQFFSAIKKQIQSMTRKINPAIVYNLPKLLNLFSISSG